MNKINDFLSLIDGYIGGSQWFVFLLLGTGVFFTIYLKGRKLLPSYLETCAWVSIFQEQPYDYTHAVSRLGAQCGDPARLDCASVRSRAEHQPESTLPA